MLKRFNINADAGFSGDNIESKLGPGKFLTNCWIIANLVHIIERVVSMQCLFKQFEAVSEVI
ncbi:hypothetical protein SAMN05661012_00441 [Chitinophaga sancti]|uniref:Uncharacterized protein n=1 Tax=Chitinophaga sancti TaxID=1004 RepID=A0A1K1M4R3_9BACT|nr:hypothetical protein SAMN05661012_00441 [Chitinophaga sancti]